MSDSAQDHDSTHQLCTVCKRWKWCARPDPEIPLGCDADVRGQRWSDRRAHKDADYTLDAEIYERKLRPVTVDVPRLIEALTGPHTVLHRWCGCTYISFPASQRLYLLWCPRHGITLPDPE